MFLRNKLAILSFTLMSLMTIPMLAVNDASTVNSRIENAKYDVQIKTPEGWSETKEFHHAIPETFQLDSRTFRGLQFKNGTVNHGCAVFFAENSDDDDKGEDESVDLLKTTLQQAQELAFPGSKISKMTISKITVDGVIKADLVSETARLNFKGTIEGNISNQAGDPSKFTLSGALSADSTQGSFAVGSGQITTHGSMPFTGTTAVHLGDDYQVIVLIWGFDEAAQFKEAYNFLKSVTVKAHTPIKSTDEPAKDVAVTSEPAPVEKVPATIDAVVTSEETKPAEEATPVVAELAVVKEEAKPAVSEPVAVAAPAASETVVISEETKPAAVEATPVVAEPAVVKEEAKPAVSEPVAVAAPAVTEAVVISEETKPAAVEATPVVAEPVVVKEEAKPSAPEAGAVEAAPVATEAVKANSETPAA